MSRPRTETADELCRRFEALLDAGVAAYDAGELAKTEKHLFEAVELARTLTAPDLLIRSLVVLASTPAGTGAGVTNYELISLVERVLDQMSEEDSVERAVLLSRMAMDLYWSPERERALDLANHAVDIARRVGERKALARTLCCREWMLWRADNVDERLARSAEIVRLAEPRDWDIAVRAHQFRLGALLEIGDIHAVDVEIAAIANLSRRFESSPGDLERYCTMRSLMRGDFAEAAKWLELERAAAESNQDRNLFPTYFAHLGNFLVEQGRAAEVLPIYTGTTSELPQIPVVRMGVATILAEVGKLSQARSELAYLAADDFRQVPHDWNWLATLAYSAQIAVQVGELNTAALLHRLLSPYARRSVTVGWGDVYYNCVSFFLAIVSAALGEFARADNEFEAAIAFDRRMGAGPALARTETAMARMLLTRRGAGDIERAEALLEIARRAAEEFGMAGLLAEISELQKRVPAESDRTQGDTERAQSSDSKDRRVELVRKGDYWELQRAGSTIHLRDSKGLGYIDILLRNPNVEFHVLRLVSADAVDGLAKDDAAIDADSDGRGPMVRSRDDAGEFLDFQAKAQYRRRIMELNAEVENARNHGDTENGERLERELEFLSGEIRRAVGIGGRDRLANSNVERSRLNVTRAIRLALAKLVEVDPSAGVFLSRCIQTGTFCSYNPLP